MNSMQMKRLWLKRHRHKCRRRQRNSLITDLGRIRVFQGRGRKVFMLSTFRERTFEMKGCPGTWSQVRSCCVAAELDFHLNGTLGMQLWWKTGGSLKLWRSLGGERGAVAGIKNASATKGVISWEQSQLWTREKQGVKNWSVSEKWLFRF